MGIRAGVVEWRSRPARKGTPSACNHPVGPGDEDYAGDYVRVEQATSRVINKGDGMMIGQLDGTTHATVAVTGQTVTGANRKATLTALLLAHNAATRR
jgi:hypothetical protein